MRNLFEAIHHKKLILLSIFKERSQMSLQAKISTTGKGSCDKDSFYEFMYRGNRNLKAIILHLNEKVGLLDATDVILAGCSGIH